MPPDHGRSAARTQGSRSNSGRYPLAAVAGVVALGMLLAPATTWGTIEEQRARLPPPAECDDPVEGIWMGLSHRTTYQDWNEITLKVRRDEAGSDTLHGDINAHWWMGTEKDKEPPACTPGHAEYSAHMPASGAATGMTVLFGSKVVDHYEMICGQVGHYSPDNFSGTIDEKIQEFQSVNNDGHSAVNEPVVFRRIKCLETHAPPSSHLVPPSFSPGKHAGCGR